MESEWQLAAWLFTLPALTTVSRSSLATRGTPGCLPRQVVMARPTVGPSCSFHGLPLPQGTSSQGTAPSLTYRLYQKAEGTAYSRNVS